MSRLLPLLLLPLLACAPIRRGQPPADDDDAADDDAADDDDLGDDDDIAPDDDDIAPDDDDIGVELLCDELDDELILAVVYGGPGTPAGFWSEVLPETEGALWPDWPCSRSADETEALSRDFYGATESTFREVTESRWFYSADWAFNDGFRMHIRQTRCDYWDGEVLLAGQGETWDIEPLRELASYLWWTDNHNVGGHHIVTAYEFVGNATNFLSLCHVSTVYGDWGLQDEITLWQTDWSMSQFGGQGWSTGPQEVRLILGNMN